MSPHLLSILLFFPSTLLAQQYQEFVEPEHRYVANHGLYSDIVKGDDGAPQCCHCGPCGGGSDSGSNEINAFEPVIGRHWAGVPSGGGGNWGTGTTNWGANQPGTPQGGGSSGLFSGVTGLFGGSNGGGNYGGGRGILPSNFLDCGLLGCGNAGNIFSRNSGGNGIFSGISSIFGRRR